MTDISNRLALGAIALFMPACLFTNPATPQDTSPDMGSAGEDMSAPSDMNVAPEDMASPPADMTTSPDMAPPLPDMPAIDDDMDTSPDMEACPCPLEGGVCPQACDCTTKEDAQRLCIDPGARCQVILTGTCFKKRDVIACQGNSCMGSECSQNPVICIDSFLTDAMAKNTSGAAIATSGDWLAISDPDEKVVRLYERDADNTWKARQLFNKPNTADLFGVSLAMTDNILVVGSPVGSDTVQDEAVFVYEFDGTMWRPAPPIISPDNTAPLPMGFGSKVVLDGDLLAVSQVRNPTRRQVLLYERRAMGNWRQVGTCEDNAGAGNSQHAFGRAIALDNTLGVVIVGDPENSSATLCARIPDGSSETKWETVQFFDVESVYKNSMPGLDNPRNSEFGASVAIGKSANSNAITLAIGAPNATLQGIDRTGYVAIHNFVVSNGAYMGMTPWEPLIDSPGGRFGAKLIPTGSGVLVSAPDYLHADGAAGTIFEFAEDAAGIPQITLLETEGARFGDLSIAVNKEREEFAIGLPNYAPDEGTFTVIPLPSSLMPQGPQP